ncbi:MAG: PIG-L family deacetylase [Gemmatimonadetes bacterium]|nr:PIG-L family deacetylase [Gemmatimonadota bacterium]MDA1101994.1 PIG-L family deacetylase [Gemmatimonadota bacterium]
MRAYRSARWRVLLVLALSVLSGSPTEVRSQSMEGTGVVATGLLLRQMDGVKRVLMIGAHPDDEDTSLLTTLARGWGAETAYLALTRGDGGQNLIGPELWEGLGIVRTGELMAARRLDGGDQFFTRAFDYGFSKSAEEALSLWPSEELLADVVWVVRTYRPQVIVSVFSGTPSDGHGQHQAAGLMATAAFAAAADPARFPEQLALGLEAWAPSKLYQTSRRRFFSNAADLDDGSLDIETGRLDPLLGRSLLQLSMESRSQHRSQDMGSAQPAGPRLTGVLLVESRVRDEGQELFSGIDTTLVGLTARLPAATARAARQHLEAYRTSVHRAIEGLGLDPARIAPDLMEAMDHLSEARRVGGAARDREFDRATAEKHDVLNRAIMAATGVSFDVRSDDDLIVPGQTVRVQAQLWNGGAYTIAAPDAVLHLPEGWRASLSAVEGLAPSGMLETGSLARWTFEVAVPRDADVSRLYYLRQDRDGVRYRWPNDHTLWGLPRDPIAVTADAVFSFLADADQGASAVERTMSREWRYVGVDPSYGEYERLVLVVPSVSVRASPAGLTWPQGRTGARSVSVVVRSESDTGDSGRVSLRAPSGWTVSPSVQEFELGQAGAERAMTFAIQPDAAVTAGRHRFEVVAETAEGRSFQEGYALIDYDHIERAALFAPAEVVVSIVPVAVSEGLRVGYIMGSGDDGPEAVRQMGAEVELLDEARVRDGAFEGFGTIVLGVRAYETRPDVQAAAGQLLDFARSGGTVVVQYNRGPLGNLAPYDLVVGRNSPRVADETAAVLMLEPAAPIFTTPNRITETDFDDWVQERGLYFGAEWDDRYVPVMELNDPGEEPKRGSLLVAPVGDGLFVYTGLSFFRQWFGQVPGAYRLFANLISLRAEEWNAFAPGR